MNKTMHTLKQHVSIRKFKTDPIPENVLQEILSLGQCASTSSYVQAYHMIRITDTDLRKQLSDLCGQQAYIISVPEFVVFCADLNKLDMACTLHGVSLDEGYMESLLVATVDASLVAQNVMVAAESLGLGGVYIGGIRNKIDEVTKLLHLPMHVYPVFGMCLGYPDQAPGPKPRLPLDLVLSENHYKTVTPEAIAAYDDAVRAYYIERTRGKIDRTWTEQMSEKMKKETRPFMLEYLKKQGFATK